ncbi:2-oxo-4-hydroxy-4-carboxy-5-ureidoimidazoline decarboxylase-like [Zophobas morio]|uniref:2-oxo-4-hydroxy-4-carboxy-5-ureidoimidazoline decarboxylase-like n=1 Tax=Zophobas morio TaxID=2755281 RepID=UPI003082D5BA
MPMTILTIQEVNNIISEHFIKIFGNVVEHYPAAAIGILRCRPFKNAGDISVAFNKFLDKLSLREKQNILQLYPDLVAKLADLSKFMLHIEQYQRISGADLLTIEDKQKLGQLNKRYREKFGFPFVTYGKEYKDVFTIFSEMETRIENNIEEETELAINEVKKIGKLRICEILQR